MLHQSRCLATCPATLAQYGIRARTDPSHARLCRAKTCLSCVSACTVQALQFQMGSAPWLPPRRLLSNFGCAYLPVHELGGFCLTPETRRVGAYIMRI